MPEDIDLLLYTVKDSTKILTHFLLIQTQTQTEMLIHFDLPVDGRVEVHFLQTDTCNTYHYIRNYGVLINFYP